MSAPAGVLDLDAAALAEVRRILCRQVPEFEVRAFGSRTTGRARAYSDLDLAVLTVEPLPLERRAGLVEAFDESELPMRVDLLDWAATADAFRRIVERDGIVVQTAATVADRA